MASQCLLETFKEIIMKHLIILNCSYCRFYFEEMEIFIHTKTTVYHIESDLRDGKLLFTEGSSLRITDGEDITTLVGSPTKYGYKEGIGKVARFFFLTGFSQINDSVVIVSDHENSCLRLINRDSLSTSMFAGTCTSIGHRDGINARFNRPHSTLLNTNSSGLFVTDKYNDALKYVDLISKEVTTLLEGGLYYPRGLTYDMKRENLLITDSHFIIRFDLRDHSPTGFAGSRGPGVTGDDLSTAKFSRPYEIILLGNNLLIADQGNNRLRAIWIYPDTDDTSVSSVCPSPSAMRDRDNATCTILRPYSLLYLNGFLYVGQSANMSRIRGK